MKRKICFVLVLILICTAMASCGQQPEDTSEYDAGYDAGYDDGYDTGYKEGREEAYQVGYQTGKVAGYDAGNVAGFERGRKAGYDEGYDAGLQEGSSAAAADTTTRTAPAGADTSTDTGAWSPPADRWVPPWTDPDQTVYVSNRSHTIHSIPNCSGMKNYFETTFWSAVEEGYDFCLNCW